MRKLVYKIYIPLLFSNLIACNPFDPLKESMHKCTEIDNIYYKPGRHKFQSPEYFRQAMKCPYTLTEIQADVPTMYIQSKFYDEYKKEYESYGLVYPYPREVGSAIMYPINY